MPKSGATTSSDSFFFSGTSIPGDSGRHFCAYSTLYAPFFEPKLEVILPPLLPCADAAFLGGGAQSSILGHSQPNLMWAIVEAL